MRSVILSGAKDPEAPHGRSGWQQSCQIASSADRDRPPRNDGSEGAFLLHYDCDAFFASVAQATHPQWRGKPVVTGHERGIISSASYEAKAAGIRRGVALWDVPKLCPGCIVTDTDYVTCELYSRRVEEMVRAVFPTAARASIDEGYARLEVTVPEESRRQVVELQRKIEESLAIGVSFGIAETATLAKAASKHRKPRGVVAVPPQERERFLAELPLEDVCGFGPATVRRLTGSACRTALDFTRWPLSRAAKLLGKSGADLWHELNGVAVYNPLASDDDPPGTCTSSRTVEPTDDAAVLWAYAVHHLEHVCADLRSQGLVAGQWSVWLRRQPSPPPARGEVPRAAARGGGGPRSWWYREATAVGASRTVRPTALPWEATAMVREAFLACYESGVRYRSVGITASAIVPASAQQLSLSDSADRLAAGQHLAAAVDELNGRYGRGTVRLAATLPSVERRRAVTFLPFERYERRLPVPVWEVKV